MRGPCDLSTMFGDLRQRDGNRAPKNMINKCKLDEFIKIAEAIPYS